MKKIAAFIVILLLVLAGGLLLLARQNPGPGDPAWQALLREGGWDRYARMDGYRIHYLDTGLPSGPPLLLIHGYGDSVYAWHRNMIPLIEAGFHVVALDLPGFGSSGTPSGFPFTAEAYVAEIVALLDHLGLERVDLIGNSLGGNLSLFLADRFPGRVRRAVTVDPVVYPSRKHGFLIALARSEWAAALVKPFIGPWVYHLAMRRSFNDPSLVTDVMISQRVQPFNRPDFRDNLIQVGAHYFSDAFLELSKNYGRISRPVLIIWGSARPDDPHRMERPAAA